MNLYFSVDELMDESTYCLISIYFITKKKVNAELLSRTKSHGGRKEEGCSQRQLQYKVELWGWEVLLEQTLCPGPETFSNI